MPLDLLKNIFRPFVFKKRHRKAILRDMRRYNMVTGSGEAYYFTQYMNVLEPVLGDDLTGATILDLGCGQGRFAIPMAKRGASLHAVDISPDAIAFARQYASEHKVSDGIQFANCAFDDFFRGCRDRFDFVLCIEALYMDPDYLRTLSNISRHLKTGGKAIIGLRPRLYDVLDKVYHKDFDGAHAVLNAAASADRPYRLKPFNSHTADESKRLIAAHGLRIDRFFGIGALSGLDGDPFSQICHPGALDPADADRLQALEQSVGTTFYEFCRYFLIVAGKP